jgi:hypothetical protein
VNPLTQFKTYINKSNIDIPFLIIIAGLVLVPILHYSWIVSMITCVFLKEDDFK